MHKILKIALFAFGVISAILWYLLPDSDMPAAEAAASGAMNGMFIITYVLLGLAILASLLFTLKNLFSNPQGLKKTLFVIGGFLLVVIISYVLASGTDVAPEYAAMTEESTVKYIGMGLNVFFILTAVAILSLVVPGVKNMFSK
jgi:membrane protease YdiL (CAAX protease family)